MLERRGAWYESVRFAAAFCCFPSGKIGDVCLMGSGSYSGMVRQTCEVLEAPIWLKRIQGLLFWVFGLDCWERRGVQCCNDLRNQAVELLFCFLNSAMGSKSLIWMNDVLIDMAIRSG